MLFRGLSLDLAPGDVLQVTGANGTGKSSLLRILAGLLLPYAGEATSEGTIGLLDEKPALDEYVPLGKALDFWRAIDGTPDTLRPVSVEHLLDVPIRYLSTGQRKRAALARLDAQGADIWLLDEPLNGLDKDAVSSVGAMVDAHRRANGICILASHQPFPLDDLKMLDIAEYAP
ncbi:Heme-transporting ATPase [Altererythrobacter insulae]|nr:Heme-transporting ATPase [Altererythrobacter insulae]